MQRWDILNTLIQFRDYKTYLEIGVQDYTSCCAKVNLPEENKVAVDPSPRNKCNFIGTSDEYFAQLDPSIKFDLIFIDGLHLSEQVLKDIDNSLKHLTEGGAILCHDCLPPSENHQVREDHGGPWNGDVWKAIAQLRTTREDLIIKTINTDWGCALIERGFSKKYIPLTKDYLTYDYFQQNVKEMMNVVTTSEIL